MVSMTVQWENGGYSDFALIKALVANAVKAPTRPAGSLGTSKVKTVGISVREPENAVDQVALLTVDGYPAATGERVDSSEARLIVGKGVGQIGSL
ncbi:hypothetical protein MAM1_0286d09257 [Mucor ambiguus]|uniref:Uncharacterized protein n=1 Tax=Mucor ambiguus TaxID=91626 RepID=A0A0C9LX63_9FUNG|nr:hypothetical protein MAM1_0286d09257 [Mucor ambiguus]